MYLLSYNSFPDDGVMGKGFSLFGYLFHHKVNSTVFHSGYISDIEFDDTDKYMHRWKSFDI